MSLTTEVAESWASPIPALQDLSTYTDLDGIVAQMVRRVASPDFDSWWTKAENSGFCANPIRLIGTDGFGREHRVWTRCNNRRATACPSCSDLYARDTWQLVHAGLHGGHHDLPVTVADHPQVFVTLTAPSFGVVHSAGDDTSGRRHRCHPARGGRERCRHGRPLWCGAIHHETDGLVGQPLCGDCYDYSGHILFAWHAPELWRRFTITLRRLLSRHMRALGESPTGVRVSFVKVAEMQRRVLPHFHAVIRLDGVPHPGEPPTRPTSSVIATDLAFLIQCAADRATVTVPDPHSPVVSGARVLRFGTQTDIQPLESKRGDRADAVTARRTGRSVAAYLAKYVTKSVTDFGVGMRRMSPLAVPDLDVTAHVRAILNTIVDLASHEAYKGMDRWLHTLGYRGHITTKSRLFSTTMGALRSRRATWARQRQPGDPPKSMTEELREESARSEPMEWEFDRAGLSSLGERALVLSAAQRMIEHRHIARDNLRIRELPPRGDTS